VVDATGNYRLIWVFPAATGIAHALVNTRLRFPVHRPGTDMVAKLWQWSVTQTELMAETGIVAGLLAAPLLGEVTKEDADSAVIIDVARDILGDPYQDEHVPESDDSGHDDDHDPDPPATDGPTGEEQPGSTAKSAAPDPGPNGSDPASGHEKPTLPEDTVAPGPQPGDAPGAPTAPRGRTDDA
jgi:hypothetical protein